MNDEAFIKPYGDYIPQTLTLHEYEHICRNGNVCCCVSDGFEKVEFLSFEYLTLERLRRAVLRVATSHSMHTRHIIVANEDIMNQIINVICPIDSDGISFYG